MLSREKAVEFVSDQLSGVRESKSAFHRSGEYDSGAWHYGKCDVRELLDAIYGEKPKNKKEMLM